MRISCLPNMRSQIREKARPMVIERDEGVLVARTDLSEDVLASDAARCAEIKSVASLQLFVTCRYTFRY